MLSRFIVRTVLLAILSGLSYLGWLTWTANLENIGQRIAATIVEAGVFLAALSLLIQSFISFGSATFRREDYKYYLWGIYMFDEKKPAVNVRTCELFALRSVFLAFAGLLTAGFLCVLYGAVKAIILFLFSPHASVVEWSLILEILAMTAVALPAALLMTSGSKFLDKKLSDKHSIIKTLAQGIYWSVTGGMFLGITGKMAKAIQEPLWLAILYGVGITVSLAACIGIVFLIGLGLYKLVGRLSQKYSFLQSAWNTICPVQTINFEE